MLTNFAIKCDDQQSDRGFHLDKAEFISFYWKVIVTAIHFLPLIEVEAG